MAEKVATQLSFDVKNEEGLPSPSLLAPSEAAKSNMMVVKANDLIQKSRYDLTLIEQKIVLRIIAMINPEDTELPLYEFNIQEFAYLCGIDMTSGGNYANIKKRLKTLADKSFYVTLPGTETTTLVRWIEKPYINKGSGKVKIRLDNDLKPFLLQLQEYFTQFNITFTLPMKSQYSVRLYELFKSYENLESVTLDLEELKKVLRCEKYVQWTDFKRFVLEIALNEINGMTDIQVAYLPKKTGRKITRLFFTIKRLSKEQREDVLKSIQEKMNPQKLNWEMAKIDAQNSKEVLFDDDDPTPSLPYIPSPTGTIEYAAGADPERMDTELRLRAGYEELAAALTPKQLEAVDLVLRALVKMAGNNRPGEVTVNGGHKRTFLLLNDVILKYGGMKEWFRAAAQKYEDFFEDKAGIKNPMAYLEACVLHDLELPEGLIASQKTPRYQQVDLLQQAYGGMRREAASPDAPTEED